MLRRSIWQRESDAVVLCAACKPRGGERRRYSKDTIFFDACGMVTKGLRGMLDHGSLATVALHSE
jgi:hypothetical protein